MPDMLKVERVPILWNDPGVYYLHNDRVHGTLITQATKHMADKDRIEALLEGVPVWVIEKRPELGQKFLWEGVKELEISEILTV